MLDSYISTMGYKPKPKGHKYWTAKHEKLCCEWVSATTQQEYTRIYTALKPTMVVLINNIIRRYFAVPPSKYQDVLDEILQWVFLRLSRYDPKQKKAYSFCGTVVKNRMHEVWVRVPATTTRIHPEYIDDAGGFETMKPIDYGEHTEHDIDAILAFFDMKKAGVQKYMVELEARKHEFKNTSYYYIPEMKRNLLFIEICELCKEFITKFECVNADFMANYVLINSNIPMTQVRRYFHKLFNMKVTVYRDRYGQHEDVKGYTCYNDDWTPIDNKVDKRIRIKNIDNQYNYF